MNSLPDNTCRAKPWCRSISSRNGFQTPGGYCKASIGQRLETAPDEEVRGVPTRCEESCGDGALVVEIAVQVSVRGS
jgi:hypothetical protein